MESCDRTSIKFGARIGRASARLISSLFGLWMSILYLHCTSTSFEAVTSMKQFWANLVVHSSRV